MNFSVTAGNLGWQDPSEQNSKVQGEKKADHELNCLLAYLRLLLVPWYYFEFTNETSFTRVKQ